MYHIQFVIGIAVQKNQVFLRHTPRILEEIIHQMFEGINQLNKSIFIGGCFLGTSIFEGEKLFTRSVLSSDFIFKR